MFSCSQSYCRILSTWLKLHNKTTFKKVVLLDTKSLIIPKISIFDAWGFETGGQNRFSRTIHVVTNK